MGQHPATSATSATGWQQVASQALLDGNGFPQAEPGPVTDPLAVTVQRRVVGVCRSRLLLAFRVGCPAA